MSAEATRRFGPHLRAHVTPSWCQACRDEVPGHLDPEEAVFHTIQVAQEAWGRVEVVMFDSPDESVTREPRLSFDIDDDGAGWIDLPLDRAREVVEALSAATETLESIVSVGVTR